MKIINRPLRELFVLSIIVSAFFLVTLSGCGDDNTLEQDYLLEREMFLGNWDVIDEFSNIRNDSVLIEIERELEVNIDEEVITVRNLSFANPTMIDTFSWYYQLAPERFVRVESFGSTISNTYIHTVIEREGNTITLFHESFVENGGVKTCINSTWNMTKK